MEPLPVEPPMAQPAEQADAEMLEAGAEVAAAEQEAAGQEEQQAAGQEAAQQAASPAQASAEPVAPPGAPLPMAQPVEQADAEMLEAGADEAAAEQEAAGQEEQQAAGQETAEQAASPAQASAEPVAPPRGLKVVGVQFSKLGAPGDFEWEIRNSKHPTAMYIFNDNAADHGSAHAGGGNAVIRPFSHGPNAQAAGICTGESSAAGGYGALDECARRQIDSDFAELMAKLQTGRFTEVRYSSEGPGGRLGTSIFQVAPEVIEYIMYKLNSLGAYEDDPAPPPADAAPPPADPAPAPAVPAPPAAPAPPAVSAPPAAPVPPVPPPMPPPPMPPPTMPPPPMPPPAAPAPAAPAPAGGGVDKGLRALSIKIKACVTPEEQMLLVG